MGFVPSVYPPHSLPQKVLDGISDRPYYRIKQSKTKQTESSAEAVMMRSILAVLGGWGIVGVLVVLTDLVLGFFFPEEYRPGRLPPDYLLAVSLGTAIAYSVLGGWLTAVIALRKRWRHILGLVLWGELMGLMSTVFTWGQIQHWYSIALLLAWFPAVALGGYFRIGNLRFRD
jgi:hypothetical protein